MPFDETLQAHLRKQTPTTTARRAAKREPAQEGRVIMFSNEKGFGFIAQGGDAGDVFVPQREPRKSGIAQL